MKPTGKEVEEAVRLNPNMEVKVLAKKLGVKVNRIYAARVRIENEKKKIAYANYIPEEPKPVPVRMKVCDKGKYVDYVGLDVSAFWGL